MNSFTVSTNSVTVMAYHHLMSMIKEEIVNEPISNQTSTETPMTISETNSEVKKGWLY